MPGLFFVKRDGTTILQKVEAFETIDLDGDLIPYKPTSDDLEKFTEDILIAYGQKLGVSLEKKGMKKDEMIKLLMQDLEKSFEGKDDSYNDSGDVATCDVCGEIGRAHV